MTNLINISLVVLYYIWEISGVSERNRWSYFTQLPLLGFGSCWFRLQVELIILSYIYVILDASDRLDGTMKESIVVYLQYLHPNCTSNPNNKWNILIFQYD